MNMLGSIVDGKTTAADLFFLIGLILAFLSALSYATRSPHPYTPAVSWAAVGCIGLGLLLL